MTIDKLDGILRKFEDVHHQSPEYICLAEGTYQEIVRQTGASTTTIGRVNRSLQYGADGYGIVLDRLDEAQQK